MSNIFFPVLQFKICFRTFLSSVNTVPFCIWDSNCKRFFFFFSVLISSKLEIPCTISNTPRNQQRYLVRNERGHFILKGSRWTSLIYRKSADLSTTATLAMPSSPRWSLTITPKSSPSVGKLSSCMILSLFQMGWTVGWCCHVVRVWSGAPRTV